MKKILLGLICVALLAFGTPALAQNPQTVKLCVPTSGTACGNVTGTNPLPVTGSFSATLSGFTPNGNYGTLTATAASSASTALPSGAVVAFQNLSTVDVSCVLSAGAATATTNKLIVRAGATVFLTVGSNVNAACINQTGSASNVVAMAGGTGLGTNFGGGGGAGAITIASGGVASGAYASGSIASGAMVDLGAQADAVCGSATGTCSLIALVKYLNNSVNAAIPAGTNLIGDVNLRQGGTALSTTNGAYFNQLQGNAVLSATNPSFARLTDGTNAQVTDPCQAVAKTTKAFSQTASAVLQTGTSAKKTYLCSMAIIAGAAEIVSLTAGTGSVCGTNTVTLMGSSTAANGLSFAANGGMTYGNGGFSVIGTTVNADDLCLIQSGSNRVAGSITYVQL